MILGLSAAVYAASLDNVEVGGVWGSPLAENPTAIWWNPAGLSQAHGTQTFLEVAPTFGHVTFDRVDPYNGGTDTLRLAGPIPFAGVSSDFGVKGLGVGAAFLVPYARGGKSDFSPGPASFAVRSASVKAFNATLAVGYQPPNVPISLGGSVAYVISEWDANLDAEATTTLDAQISQFAESGYTDAQIEDQDYAANLDFGSKYVEANAERNLSSTGQLSDTAISFSAGARVDLEEFKVSFAYVHGASIANTGIVVIHQGCPPDSDEIGRLGAESYGLCYADLKGTASVAYDLPARVQGALGYTPNDDVAVQVMGAYVFWSAYRDFDIEVGDVDTLNEFENNNGGLLVNQQRLWARDNVDTYWAAIDAKVRIRDIAVIGGRVLYDRRAVPNVAMSPNNVDTDILALTPNVTIEATKALRVGLSYGHSFMFTRVIDDNGFFVTLEEGAHTAENDRYFYPQMNGTYSGSIDRVGIFVSGSFGVKEEDQKKAPF